MRPLIAKESRGQLQWCDMEGLCCSLQIRLPLSHLSLNCV